MKHVIYLRLEPVEIKGLVDNILEYFDRINIIKDADKETAINTLKELAYNLADDEISVTLTILYDKETLTLEVVDAGDTN